VDLNSVRASIVTNVSYLDPDKKVPLHDHAEQDEVFYCLKGSGFGVLEDGEVELKVGQSFIVPAGTRHSLRTDGDLHVSSFLVPVMDDRLQQHG